MADPMFEAARALCARGWVVVPVRPGTKEPATGWKDPSDWICDRHAVRAVWGPGGTHEGHGVGILPGPSGLNVLDLDKKPDVDGEASLAAMGHKIEGTLKRRTPSGGHHGYYEAQAGPVPSQSGQIGPGIDTRGKGGMVIWAMPDRPYETVEDLPPAPTPRWLYEAVGPVTEGPTEGKEFASVEAARRYVAPALQKLRDAVEGERNEAVRDAALCVGHFGDEFWDLDEAREMVLEAAVPSGADTEHDTAGTLANALDDARGQWTHRLAATEDTFRRDVEEEKRKTRVRETARGELAAERLPKLEVLDLAELLTTPMRPALVDGLIYRDSLFRFFGPPGGGKTFVVLDMLLHIALGRPWRGRPVEQANVLYVMAEGRASVALRVLAWCRHHDVDPASLGRAFRVIPAAVLLTPETIGPVVAAAGSSDARVVVFDTQRRMTAGLDENSSTDMSRVVDAMDVLRRALADSAIGLVAHSGLDTRGRARGSGAIEAGMDTEVEVTKAKGSPDVTVALSRSKVRETGEEILFQLRTYALPDQPENAAVLVPGGGQESMKGGNFQNPLVLLAEAEFPRDLAQRKAAARMRSQLGMQGRTEELIAIYKDYCGGAS